MLDKGYTYLKFVLFKDLENWSVSHLLGKDMGYTDRYSIVSIGDIIDKCHCPIEIKDDIQYKQITLKTNGGGAVLRGTKWGKDIKTKKQYIASDGQFIMSKIDARNGAFGIITKDLDGAVVTSDFPLFNVDTTKILPEYLALVASTKEFAQFAQSCSRGTTNRQRIDMNLFLSQQIPLPSLSEQKAIVSAYENKIQEAATLEDRAIQVEHNIDNYLLSELGITHNGYTMSEPPTSIASEPQVEYVVSHKQGASISATNHCRNGIKNEYKYLKFVRFKDVTEWGYNIIKANENRTSSIYPTKKVREICLIGSGGTPSRSVAQYYQGNIPWIKTGEVVNESIYDTEEHITQDAIDNSSAKLYPKGSLIIAMYGQGDTRGRTAKMEIDATTNQACAVLYNIDNSLVETDYLWYYLQSRYNDLRSLASGNNQPNLNADKIKNYDVVVPPVEIQNTIVGHINEQKEQIKQLKQQAETLRKDAWEEFEKEIFE